MYDTEVDMMLFLQQHVGKAVRWVLSMKLIRKPVVTYSHKQPYRLNSTHGQRTIALAQLRRDIEHNGNCEHFFTS